MLRNKAQTATEYLVILAVVIVIALIVVGVLGGIPSIGGGASANAVKAQLANYGPLKIDNWVVFRNETKVIVQNINPGSIRLNSFTINGTETVLNKQLRAGQRFELSADVAMLNPDKYSFPISFNWTDTSTNAAYLEDEEFALLTGTSVDNPYTVYTRRTGRSTSLSIDDQYFDHWDVGTSYFIAGYVNKGSNFLTNWVKETTSNYCSSAILSQGTASISIDGCSGAITTNGISHDFNVTNIQTDVYITLDFED